MKTQVKFMSYIAYYKGGGYWDLTNGDSLVSAWVSADFIRTFARVAFKRGY